MSVVGTGYEFVVEFGGVQRDVFPLAYKSCAVKWEEQDDLIFLRQKFSGELIFANDPVNYHDDFDYFFGIDRDANSRCEEITVYVYKDGSICFQGFFTTNKGKFDVDSCLFKVTPAPDDDYRDIFDKWKIEYNILDVAKVTVKSPNVDHLPTTYTYTRCRWLYDVIEFLAQKLIPTASVASLFFTDDYDYVVKKVSSIDHIVIAQKMDIIRPTSTEPATKAMLSFSGLMDILRVMFNVYWDYDSSTNAFTVEHYSYFGNTDVIDTRSENLAKGKKKYSYESYKIPERETFEMMEAHKNAAKLDFRVNSIIYTTPCVTVDDNSKEVKYSIPVTTDIEWIEDPQGNAEASKEGFILMACYDNGGDWTIIEDIGYISLASLENATLSWANLLMNYHRHNRPFMTGSINSHEMDFISTKRIIRQEELSIEGCECPFDPTVKFKTELGDEVFGGEYGYPVSIEVMFNGLIKLNLRYGEPENTNEGIPNPEIVQYGLFSTVETGYTENCFTSGGCDSGDLAMAYINTTTGVLYWDAMGTNKINQTGNHAYYWWGCVWINDDEVFPGYGYYGFTFYTELDENSIYVNDYEC
jgi:hypothetical protein